MYKLVRMWYMVSCCIVVMGFTSTLTYLGPFIYIPMTIPVRLYVQVNINIIVITITVIIIIIIIILTHLSLLTLRAWSKS